MQLNSNMQLWQSNIFNQPDLQPLPDAQLAQLQVNYNTLMSNEVQELPQNFAELVLNLELKMEEVQLNWARARALIDLYHIAAKFYAAKQDKIFILYQRKMNLVHRRFDHKQKQFQKSTNFVKKIHKKACSMNVKKFEVKVSKEDVKLIIENQEKQNNISKHIVENDLLQQQSSIYERLANRKQAKKANASALTEFNEEMDKSCIMFNQDDNINAINGIGCGMDSGANSMNISQININTSQINISQSSLDSGNNNNNENCINNATLFTQPDQEFETGIVSPQQSPKLHQLSSNNINIYNPIITEESQQTAKNQQQLSYQPNNWKRNQQLIDQFIQNLLADIQKQKQEVQFSKIKTIEEEFIQKIQPLQQQMIQEKAGESLIIEILETCKNEKKRKIEKVMRDYNHIATREMDELRDMLERNKHQLIFKEI